MEQTCRTGAVMKSRNSHRQPGRASTFLGGPGHASLLPVSFTTHRRAACPEPPPPSKSRAPGGILGSWAHPRLTQLVSLGWSPRTCLSNRSPRDPSTRRGGHLSGGPSHTRMGSALQLRLSRVRFHAWSLEQVPGLCALLCPLCATLATAPAPSS